MENFSIRKAVKQDTPLIFDLIMQLAIYEKLEDEVVTTVEELEHHLFEKQQAQVIIAEENGMPVGFALYFFNFSTFLGKHGLYLEDLFVKSEYRGKGYGKRLLKQLAKIAKEENCGRMEWWVLDWNEPSIAFYKSLGAKPMDEWTVFRVTGKDLDELAK